jgi:DNA adenine methylase
VNSDLIQQKPRPFLKWAGGKALLLPFILEHVPSQFNRYFEPFLGGGALFYSLSPKTSFLSDLSEDLINTYLQVRDNPKKVIELLKGMRYEKKSYYEIRATRPHEKISRAARFIYLNKSCWNGLYRVNSRGDFNVPFGRYSNPLLCDVGNLESVSRTLQGAHISVADFEEVLDNAKEGDFVYLDPPYTTSHNNNGFIEYNSRIFSLDDQIRLRKVFENLCQRGCYVVLSNSDHEFIRELYKGFKRFVIPRRNTISSKKNKRGAVTELIITGEIK